MSLCPSFLQSGCARTTAVQVQDPAPDLPQKRGPTYAGGYLRRNTVSKPKYRKEHSAAFGQTSFAPLAATGPWSATCSGPHFCAQCSTINNRPGSNNKPISLPSSPCSKNRAHPCSGSCIRCVRRSCICLRPAHPRHSASRRTRNNYLLPLNPPVS